MDAMGKYRATERLVLQEIAAELNAAGCPIDWSQCRYVVDRFQGRMTALTLSPRLCEGCRRHPSACKCDRPAAEMVR